jgi:serine kinase of HPr protein (carbohydrate metabolism regulator)
MTSSPHAGSDAGFVHATAIVLGEDGIVIFGASGAGKSSLALALIETAPPGTFARLVGDDRVRLVAAGDRLLVGRHPDIQGRIERRGQGIMRLAFEPAAVVRLVVELGVAETPRFPAESAPYRCAGATVRRLAMPAASPLVQAASVRAALGNAAEI